MFAKIAFVAGLLSSTIIFAADFSAAAKEEMDRLAGDWRIVSTERDGKVENNPPEPVKVRVEEDKLLLDGKEVGLRITMITVDSKPKLLDISHPETKKTLEAIYELTDDEWRICLNIEGEGARDRPSDFNTTGKTKFVKVILKREKQ